MIGGLIINSYTKWSATLADITNAGWVAISEGLVRTFTYKVPIGAVLIIVALVAVSWYAVRIIRRATNITAPNTAFKFLNYREDVIDGVLCRWDYKQPYHRTQFRLLRTCYVTVGIATSSSGGRTITSKNAPHVRDGRSEAITPPFTLTISFGKKSRGTSGGKTQCRSKTLYD